MNVIGFDLVWFGLVYFGNAFIPIAIAMLIAHIYFISNKLSREVKLIFIVATVGCLVDWVLHLVGVFDFVGTDYLPAWLVTLWLCFAATLYHSLVILKHSKILQFLVGALLAPFSYLAGHELEAVSFGFPIFDTYFLLSVIWAILMIFFFQFMSYLDKEELSYE